MKKAYATQQLFRSGKVMKAKNFDTSEMFIKWEIIHG